MKTVLVTGANGFIGSKLVKRLLSLQINALGVTSRDGDISNAGTWARFPRSQVVVHLAAKTSVPASWECAPQFVQTNCQGTAHALNYCRQQGAKLIFISSYMYGDCGSQAIAETAQVDTKNPYALTKQFCEELCRIYRDNFAVDARILRPFNVYGPGQGPEFLIPKIVNEATTLGKIKIKDLEPRRDFVYVDDVTQAIVDLINYGGPFSTFNIGTGRSHSVLDVINLIQSLLGRRIEVINENLRRPGEIMDSIADISLAKREFGWQPRFTLAAGIAEMIGRT